MKMTLDNFPHSSGPQKPASHHSHSLSINSVSSIAEPATPPSMGLVPKLYFWDSNKMNGNLVLPSFNLESHGTEDRNHIRQGSMDSSGSDKENRPNYHASQVSRSSKVDKDYLASITKTPLTQLQSEILRLAKDQHGCRFLQKRIDENFVVSASLRQANYEIIFHQVKTSLYELIIDPFGNYLVQKLIDYFQETDLDFCLNSLNSNMFLIAINQHGTRALQKIIDKISTESQFVLLMQGLKSYIIELIKDLNGNHVIQKVLNKYPPEKCQFIYDSILGDLIVVATHKHGCCVLQKCLNHVTAAQHVAFANVILKYENFSRLVNDQFGNYVLQYLISIDSIDVNYKLYQNIFDYGLGNLCMLKFSSNVVEKLMTSCYKTELKLMAFSTLKFTIIAHVLNGDMNKLINNAYGNYVVQTLTDILINPKVSYFIDLPLGERQLLPALAVLLDENFQASVDTLQVQVIKKWFQNCKVDSTFGKKIQAKINHILNGSGKVYQKKSPRGSSSSLQFGSDFEADLHESLGFASRPPFSMQENGAYHVSKAQAFNFPAFQQQNMIQQQQRHNYQGQTHVKGPVPYHNASRLLSHEKYPIPGYNTAQTSQQFYTPNQKNYLAPAAHVYPPYQKGHANFHTASYPVINPTKTGHFNSTDYANKSRASYQGNLNGRASYDLIDNQFAYDAHMKVANSSFFQNNQWS